MDSRASVQARYEEILERFLFAPGTPEAELELAAAFELGRSLVCGKASPDDIVALHQEAVGHIARRHPTLLLGQIAGRLDQPLLELTMAHGMAFREQLDHRIQELVRREQASKLEALGTLSAGIAHDFNNIVGCILGFAEMAGDDLPAGSRGQGHVEQIVQACFRARDLVARMLTYARQTPEKTRRLNVAEQVREILAILAASLAPKLRVEFSDESGLACIQASPGQIHQVVMNLCLNAADAMLHEGLIQIRLQPAARCADAPPGHRDDLCLQITDSGPGMSPAVQARAFEPFFTTKAPHGSGLGLSVTQGIVHQLGGEITLNSRSEGPETGTTFRIYLPIDHSAPPGPGEAP
ncbi:sensor histidine kinase [Zoogloea sp.]|uniref:sensor histidine kinase n=1 Tax=Zoogloea sp. TaxID=49181 RepID=UPI00262FF925|nr:ATP-binding protein [uncultured Zoogloea sp.]